MEATSEHISESGQTVSFVRSTELQVDGKTEQICVFVVVNSEISLLGALHCERSAGSDFPCNQPDRIQHGALPTHGRPRRTHDMAEIYACICGNAVDVEERVIGSETAVCCGFEGCAEPHGYVIDINICFY